LLVFNILVLSIILWCYQLLIRADKWIVLLIVVGATTFLSPAWFRSFERFGIFPAVKIYTILFFVCWTTVLRFTSMGTQRWARSATLWLLVVNIIEALLLDISGGNAAHYLVFISGSLLLLTLPDPVNAVQITNENGARDLVYRGMTRVWILEYSVWNWSFVYMNYPEVAGQAFGVLLAPRLVGMRDPQRWLLARGFTLGVYLIVLATIPESMIRWMGTSNWETPTGEGAVGAVCSFFIGTCTLRLLLRHRARITVQIDATVIELCYAEQKMLRRCRPAAN